MIISASYRTDIPAYYRDWFLNRLAAGEALVRNPYGGKSYEVDLSPEAVSGFVFWSRNPAPFKAGFEAVAAMKKPFVLQMTLTGYPRSLEAGTLGTEAALAAMRAFVAAWGQQSLVWRYDPVILTDDTPHHWHERQVAKLARALRGLTDECVFSFAEPYRKTRRNLGAAGIDWRDPEPEEKQALLARLAAIVADAGMRPTLCAQPDLRTPLLTPARCIDGDRLSRAAGHPLEARTKGQRPGCLCAEARDIGAYDACPQGCAYCYANRSREAAQKMLARHDPRTPALTLT